MSNHVSVASFDCDESRWPFIATPFYRERTDLQLLEWNDQRAIPESNYTPYDLYTLKTKLENLLGLMIQFRPVPIGRVNKMCIFVVRDSKPVAPEDEAERAKIKQALSVALSQRPQHLLLLSFSRPLTIEGREIPSRYLMAMARYLDIDPKYMPWVDRTGIYVNLSQESRYHRVMSELLDTMVLELSAMYREGVIPVIWNRDKDFISRWHLTLLNGNTVAEALVDIAPLASAEGNFERPEESLMGAEPEPRYYLPDDSELLQVRAADIERDLTERARPMKPRWSDTRLAADLVPLLERQRAGLTDIRLYVGYNQVQRHWIARALYSKMSLNFAFVGPYIVIYADNYDLAAKAVTVIRDAAAQATGVVEVSPLRQYQDKITSPTEPNVLVYPGFDGRLYRSRLRPIGANSQGLGQELASLH